MTFIGPSAIDRPARDGVTPDGAPGDGVLPLLHVCVTCRGGLPLAEGQTPPGQHLYDAVAAALAASAVPPLRLVPVKCLAVCDQGCAVAMTGAGKWGYLLGRFAPGGVEAQAQDLLAYAAAYAASASGAVLPSRRPASLGRAVLGRLPALDGAAA